MKHIKETLQQQDKQYSAYENNPARLSKLMQRIDAAEETSRETSAEVQSSSSQANTIRTWWDKFKQFIGGETSITAGSTWQFRYAAAAMLTVIVGQTVYIASQSTTESQVYETASGDGVPVPHAQTVSSRYLVVFSPSASIGDIGKLLEETDGKLLNREESTVYILGFEHSLSDEAITRYESSELVDFFVETE